MATRLKTIEFAVPQLNTLADNTLTAMTSLTAYIPEFSGTVTFKKAVVNVSIQEGATTTTGNYTSRRIDVNVGGAGQPLTQTLTYTLGLERIHVFSTQLILLLILYLIGQLERVKLLMLVSLLMGLLPLLRG